MSEDRAVAWLREQVLARLELARKAGGGAWRTDCGCPGECFGGYPSCERVEGDDITIYPEGGHNAEQAAYIAANDPRQIIADCESDLVILDEHRTVLYPPIGCMCDECSKLAPCQTVRLLARRYRHQPGYAEHWGEAG